jgi:hypothetical protein
MLLNVTAVDRLIALGESAPERDADGELIPRSAELDEVRAIVHVELLEGLIAQGPPCYVVPRGRPPRPRDQVDA